MLHNFYIYVFFATVLSPPHNTHICTQTSVHTRTHTLLDTSSRTVGILVLCSLVGPKHLEQSLAHCGCSGTMAIIIVTLVVGAKAHNIQLQCEEVRKDFKDKLPFEFSLRK